MFKKKDFLIIFVLAFLATGLSWFYVYRPLVLDAIVVKRGWPLSFWSLTTPGFWFGAEESRIFPLPRWDYFSFGLDFLFWLVILGAVFWLVKKIKSKKAKGGLKNG